MFRILLCSFIFITAALARQSLVTYREQFDSTLPPSLPAGWSSSTNRLANGDFVATPSSPRSSPYAIVSSNASISQHLTSPPIGFTGATPVRLEFYVSRSGTHTAGLLVDASLDGGETFPITLSDTIRNPGFTGYTLCSLSLQPWLGPNSRVSFRWRLIGVPGAGASGTFRLDDVTVSCQPSNDLALTGLRASDRGVTSAGQPVALTAIVHNSGVVPAVEFKVKFFKDINGNSRAEEEEQFSEIGRHSLLPRDSAAVESMSPALHAGENHFGAVVSFAEDGNLFNDTAFVTIHGMTEKGSLVINEIMYDPVTGENEWIELFNRGSTDIDLNRWTISDRPTASGTNAVALSRPSTLLRPQGIVVVAAESTIFSRFPKLLSPEPHVSIIVLSRTSGLGMNNDGDCVILRDAAGTTIDSVAYLASWHHPDIPDPKGRSLERINPDMPSNDRRNWSTSPSILGGTPGFRNGIYALLIPTSASLSPNPNPFSPDGDGFEDFCLIRYNLPLATSIIRITIFDMRGRLVRTLANAELAGAHGETVWDGLDDSRQRVRLGPYVLFLEGINSASGVLATSRAVVVVAAKL